MDTLDFLKELESSGLDDFGKIKTLLGIMIDSLTPREGYFDEESQRCVPHIKRSYTNRINQIREVFRKKEEVIETEKDEVEDEVSKEDFECNLDEVLSELSYQLLETRFGINKEVELLVENNMYSFSFVIRPNSWSLIDEDIAHFINEGIKERVEQLFPDYVYSLPTERKEIILFPDGVNIYTEYLSKALAHPEWVKKDLKRHVKP